MSLIRYATKRDASEPEIVTALEQCGFSVVRMDKPVDLLVGFRGRCWLIECKSSDKGYGKDLNPNQKVFDSRWRGPKLVILRSAQDAIDWAVEASSRAGRAA